MHASASAAWQQFITEHEGNVAHMYLDTKGLVTIGIGNLIDPVSQALALPFQFKAINRLRAVAGRAATRAEIETEWKNLKNHRDKELLKRVGAGRAARETDLELSSGSRQQLFARVTAAHETQLTQYFPDLGSWPGDAQLGLMAMAWGLGMYFPPKFPTFSAACKKQDFETASRECNISSWNATRNQASVRLFTNAARVVANPSTYSTTETYYPRVLLDMISISA